MTSDRGKHWQYPGARWWKFDFHTHTPASDDYGKGPKQTLLKGITPTEWLLNFMRADVDCVAVTDHNSGEWIDKLKLALLELEQSKHPEFQPLYLFPGMEITANGGIHVLAVFDTDKGSADIAALLGAVKYHGNRGESNIAADLACIGVVEAICKFGGIPILAHVDGLSGAWQMSGNTLAPLFDFDGLSAMEVVNAHNKKPDSYHQRGLAWAEILGSDSHHPTGEFGSRFPGSHYTWVKMARPSLEGLRLALLDGGGFSIRRSDNQESFDPLELPYHFVEAVEVKDVKYMGRGQPAKLEFSPWLNALVGGRGTGKSTVIHALRLASSREHELEDFDQNSEPRLTFERFNRVPVNRIDKGGLTNSTVIVWSIMRDGLRYRVCRQMGNNQIVVEEEANAGGWTSSTIQTVTPERFPIRIFSQGQIAALAGEDQRALMQVIDDAAGVATPQRDLDQAQVAFDASRAQIRDLDGRLARRDATILEMQDVERKLKRFEAAGHSTILTNFQNRSRQAAVRLIDNSIR